MGIIDCLEVVHIEHQQAVKPAHVLVILQSLFDFQFDVPAIGQACQEVKKCQLFQFADALFKSQLDPRIAEDFHRAADHSLGVPNR